MVMAAKVTNSLPTDPMLTDPWILAGVEWETTDSFTVCLQPGAQVGGYGFQPGQFNMLYVFGVGEVPISICSSSKEHNAIRHTTRKVGTVTTAMGSLGVGDCIGVRGPFGSAWPLEVAQGQDVLIVAGGIGLAPLRPVLYAILADRDQYGRVVLLYGARTKEDLLYQKELQQWQHRSNLDVYVTVDRATGRWPGTVGVVPQLIPRAPIDPSRVVVMICGPEVMMRYCMPELNNRGIDASNIYVSLERNMKCAIGHCGHCQFGPHFVCRDGPVFSYQQVSRLLNIKEI